MIFDSKKINIYLETLCASGIPMSELLLPIKEQKSIYDSVGAILKKEFQIENADLSSYEKIGQEFFDFIKKEFTILWEEK